MYKDLESNINLKSTQLAAIKKQIHEYGYCLVNDISLQFEKGFLEKVNVVITNAENQMLFFENSYAIGFTSPFNFQNIHNTMLLLRTDKFSKQRSNFIYLGDVLSDYINELDNYTRDYSPADTVVKHIDPNKTPLIKLHRSRSIDLFDSKIYTDLLGLADKSPNGILQIEISKRLNIFTHRHVGKYKTNYGFLNYLDIEGTLSKFEQKNRFLTLRNERVFVNQQLISPSYATTIDFIKFQTFGLGTSANAFLFDIPEGKLTFTADIGIRYNRVPLVDSSRQFVNNQYSSIINTDVPAAAMLTWYPRIKMEVFSERRYGFYLAWSRNQSSFLTNNQYKQVLSYEKSNLNSLPIESNSRVTHSFEFFARFEPNPSDASSKVFFRTRIHFQKGDMNTFFSQIQVGYAYNIVYKK